MLQLNVPVIDEPAHTCLLDSATPRVRCCPTDASTMTSQTSSESAVFAANGEVHASALGGSYGVQRDARSAASSSMQVSNDSVTSLAVELTVGSARFSGMSLSAPKITFMNRVHSIDS